MISTHLKLFVAFIMFCATSSVTAQAKVIYTGELAKHVKGFNGPTPLQITVDNDRITKIEAGANSESPRYFKMAQKKIFPQYIGKTVDEAISLKPDAASGATYSSKAIAENIRIGLINYKKMHKKAAAKATKRSAKKKK